MMEPMMMDVYDSADGRTTTIPGIGTLRNDGPYQMMPEHQRRRRTSSQPMIRQIKRCFTGCSPCFGNSENDDANYKERKVPMRIEPKVFFANERTFLSWLHTAVTLGGIGGALLGFTKGNSNGNNIRAGLISGCILLVVSIFVAVYAMRTFWWRGKMIKERRDGPYNDTIGPFLLGNVIVSALGAILGISIYQDWDQLVGPIVPENITRSHRM